MMLAMWYLLALDPHRLDHVGKKLAGATHEGFALHVLVGAWRFADEHQVCRGIADAEHDLLAALFGEAAARAVADVFADQFQRLDRIAHAGFRPRWNDCEYAFFLDGARRGFSGRHFLSLFWLGGCFSWKGCDEFTFRERGTAVAAIKIVDAKFVVVAKPSGKSLLEMRVEHPRHQACTAILLRLRSFTT